MYMTFSDDSEPQGMKSKIILVTPELAKEMLNHNTHNRKIRKNRVDALVNEMKSGRFYENGESIVFDENGTLRDGQHRLMAVVESGKSYHFNVVYGVPTENANLYDVGVKRTAMDSIELSDDENIKDLSSPRITGVANFFLKFKKGYQGIAIPHSETMNFIKNNEKALRVISNIAVSSCNGVTTSGTISAMFAALVNGVDEKLLTHFYQVLVTGLSDSKNDFPIIAFRNRYYGKLARSVGMSIQTDSYFRSQYAIYNYVNCTGAKTSINHGKEYYKFNF